MKNVESMTIECHISKVNEGFYLRSVRDTRGKVSFHGLWDRDVVRTLSQLVCFLGPSELIPTIYIKPILGDRLKEEILEP